MKILKEDFRRRFNGKIIRGRSIKSLVIGYIIIFAILSLCLISTRLEHKKVSRRIAEEQEVEGILDNTYLERMREFQKMQMRRFTLQADIERATYAGYYINALRGSEGCL